MSETKNLELVEIPKPVYAWLYDHCCGFFAPGRGMTDAILEAMHTWQPSNITGRWQEVELIRPETLTASFAGTFRTAALIVAIGIVGYLVIKARPWK